MEEGTKIWVKKEVNPRFIGSYKIVERVGLISYRIELPRELEKIHDVFHVSMLRKYQADPSHVVATDDIEVRLDLTYEEKPMKIVAREVKVLQRK